MKLAERSRRSDGGSAAFTLPEVLVTVMLLAIAGSAFFIGMGQGFTFTQENEMNMRASQIVGEKMETIRLFTWTQLTNTSPRYVATNFTSYFYPNGDTNISTGITYNGSIAITTPTLPESYYSEMRQVTVTVNWYSGSNWSTGKIKHQLQAVTYVAHFGMQNYVYETK